MTAKTLSSFGKTAKSQPPPTFACHMGRRRDYLGGVRRRTFGESQLPGMGLSKNAHESSRADLFALLPAMAAHRFGRYVFVWIFGQKNTAGRLTGSMLF